MNHPAITEPRTTAHALADNARQAGDARRMRESIEGWQQCLAIGREHNLPDIIAMGENGLGYVFFEMGDAETAQLHLNTALGLFKSLNDNEGSARSRHNLANVQTALGQYHSAEALYAECLEFWDSGSERRATVQNALGYCYLAQAEANGLEPGFIATCLAQAEENLRKALRNATNLHLGTLELLIHSNLAAVQCLNGQLLNDPGGFAAGELLLHELASKASQQNDIKLLAIAELDLGQLLWRTGRADQAIPAIKRALKTFEELKVKDKAAEAEGFLYEIHKPLDPAVALEHLERHHALHTEHRSQRAERQSLVFNAHFELERHRTRFEIERDRALELAALNEELSEQKTILENQAQELERRATIDALTNVWNRGTIEKKLHQNLSVSNAQHEPLCVVMCDVDHFKSVNDRFGHPIGDEVLRAVSRLLREGVRGQDQVGRYGGEEFCILIAAPPGEALEVCERLRQSLEAHPWASIQNGLAVTMSFGLTLNAGDTDASILKRADDALYKAKHGGRNRCVQQ